LLATPSVSSRLERHFSGVAAQQSGNKVNKDPGRASAQAWAFSLLRRGDSALADVAWAANTQAKISRMVSLVDGYAKGDAVLDPEILSDLGAFANQVPLVSGIYKSVPIDEDDDDDNDADGGVKSAVDVDVIHASGMAAEGTSGAGDESEEGSSEAGMDIATYPTRSRSGRILKLRT